MRERIKDAIIFLSAFGAGFLVYLGSYALGMPNQAGLVAGAAVALFAGWKIKSELDSALDLVCVNCRLPNTNDANFCRACGTSLRGTKAGTSPPAIAERATMSQ